MADVSDRFLSAGFGGKPGLDACARAQGGLFWWAV